MVAFTYNPNERGRRMTAEDWNIPTGPRKFGATLGTEVLYYPGRTPPSSAAEYKLMTEYLANKGTKTEAGPTITRRGLDSRDGFPEGLPEVFRPDWDAVAKDAHPRRYHISTLGLRWNPPAKVGGSLAYHHDKAANLLHEGEDAYNKNKSYREVVRKAPGKGGGTVHFLLENGQQLFFPLNNGDGWAISGRAACNCGTTGGEHPFCKHAVGPSESGVPDTSNISEIFTLEYHGDEEEPDAPVCFEAYEYQHFEGKYEELTPEQLAEFSEKPSISEANNTCGLREAILEAGKAGRKTRGIIDGTEEEKRIVAAVYEENFEVGTTALHYKALVGHLASAYVEAGVVYPIRSDKGYRTWLLAKGLLAPPKPSTRKPSSKPAKPAKKFSKSKVKAAGKTKKLTSEDEKKLFEQLAQERHEISEVQGKRVHAFWERAIKLLPGRSLQVIKKYVLAALHKKFGKEFAKSEYDKKAALEIAREYAALKEKGVTKLPGGWWAEAAERMGAPNRKAARLYMLDHGYINAAE